MNKFCVRVRYHYHTCRIRHSSPVAVYYAFKFAGLCAFVWGE